MHRQNSIVRLAPAAIFALSLALAGCESRSPEPTPAPPSGSGATVPAQPAQPDQHGHGGQHGGPVIDLGTATIGQFSVKATRDQGEIVAGKDAPIDVTVTPTSGTTAKVVVVRFWIGVEDGSASVKARADVEDPNEPNRWHTHAEIPNPIPTGSRLWVEIEDDKGAVVKGSFDLKQ